MPTVPDEIKEALRAHETAPTASTRDAVERAIAQRLGPSWSALLGNIVNYAETRKALEAEIAEGIRRATVTVACECGVRWKVVRPGPDAGDYSVCCSDCLKVNLFDRDNIRKATAPRPFGNVEQVKKWPARAIDSL
jgi:hypothetical protein